MADVIDISPEVQAKRVLIPEYLEQRIAQLVDECQTTGKLCMVVLWDNDAPYVHGNQLAYECWPFTSAALDAAKDSVRGMDGVVLTEIDEENEK